MPDTKIIKTKKLTWLNIYNAGKNEIEYLRKKFKFNRLDLDDSLAKQHSQQPKINIRADYIFVVLLFPRYDKKEKKIISEEIDIYITNDHLITIQNIKNGEVNKLFELCEQNQAEKEFIMDKSPLLLLYEILDKLYSGCLPMIDHLSLNINEIEDNIFNKEERKMTEKILIVKRNTINFSKIIQSHKRILRKIIFCGRHFGAEKIEIDLFYNDLVDYTKNIWDTVETYQKTIENLNDTNNTLVNFRLNDIMKTLTIFSVIVFPLTLAAALFGMNTFDMPIVGTENDFWVIISFMMIATVGMFYYFKHRKWI